MFDSDKKDKTGHIIQLLKSRIPEGDDPSYHIFTQRLRTGLIHTTKIRSITQYTDHYDIVVDVVEDSGTRQPYQEHYTFFHRDLSPHQLDHLHRCYQTYVERGCNHV